MAIAEYVKWRDVNTDMHGGHEFIVMWSDRTWDLFKMPFTGYHIGKGTYKGFMDLNKMVSKKMERSEAIEYINQKFAQLEKL